MMDKATKLRVAQALVKEYGWMGVNLSAAMKAVEAGDWDDHPLALCVVSGTRTKIRNPTFQQ
jgi:hypothetical protein